MQDSKVDAFRKKFAQFYDDGLKEGRIPLEFGGPQGRDVLENTFMYGIACVMIDMLLGSMSKKGAPNDTGT